MNNRNIGVYLSESHIGLLRDALALLAAADTGLTSDCGWLGGYLAEHADEFRADKADANLAILLARAADGNQAAVAQVAGRRELTARAAQAAQRVAEEHSRRLIRHTAPDPT